MGQSAATLSAMDVLAGHDRLLEETYAESLFDPEQRGVRIDRFADRVEVYLSSSVPHKSVHEYRL